MKILVIGGSGFIGFRVLSLLTSNHHAIGTFCSNSTIQTEGRNFIHLDVNNKEQVATVIAQINPEIVIQVCGTKNIEFCAKNPDAAKQEHIEGTKNIVAAIASCQSRLVYISSDCVFDGSKSLYKENDIANPFNIYGRVKLDAERIILDSKIDSIIIRASLLFGWPKSRQANNFVLLVLAALTTGQYFYAARNLFNTPLEITQASIAIADFATSRHKGIFHIAGNERISRYNFAVKIAEVFELNKSFVIPFEDISGLRQPNSCLDASKTEATLNIKFEPLKEGLNRMKLVRPGGLH